MSKWWLRVPKIQINWNVHFKTAHLTQVDRISLNMDTGLISFTLPKEDLSKAQEALDYLIASKRLEITFTLYQGKPCIYNESNNVINITDILEIGKRIEGVINTLPQSLTVTNDNKFYLYYNNNIVSDSLLRTHAYCWGMVLENASISYDLGSQPTKLSVTMRFMTVKQDG